MYFRIKNLLSSLILPNQTADLENLFKRFLNEGGRLISDILEVINILKTKGFLLTVDIEKAFKSANHFPIFHLVGVTRKWILERKTTLRRFS